MVRWWVSHGDFVDFMERLVSDLAARGIPLLL
jgi:hypothetical protein